MILKEIAVDENGKLVLGKHSWYGGSFWGGYPSPTITLTEEEAIERGINPSPPKGKKGYYYKVDGHNVLINIEKNKKKYKEEEKKVIESNPTLAFVNHINSKKLNFKRK